MQNGVLYVGGHFTSYDDRTSTGHIVAVNPANGALLDWVAVPNSNLGVFALATASTGTCRSAATSPRSTP